MSPHHRFTVPPELEAERLDRALAILNPQWSRSRGRRLLDEERVTVDGRPGKPSLQLKASSVIEVDEPEPRPSRLDPEAIDLDVVFEDEHILVINKPAGLVVHPAAGNPAGTLVNALLHHCQCFP